MRRRIHEKNLWEKIKEGGWVMFPIGLCSVLTLFLIVEWRCEDRCQTRASLGACCGRSKIFSRHGDYVGAYNYCKEHPSPLLPMCARVAVSLLGDGKAMAEDGLMGELAKENSQMQTYIHVICQSIGVWRTYAWVDRDGNRNDQSI
jgi:biopolymer transport protein ExbB